MKTYLISRTSLWNNEKPCDEAYPGKLAYWDYRTFKSPEEHDAKLVRDNNDTKPWLDEGTEHGFYPNGIMRKLHDRDVWFIDLESIDDAFERYGDIIVRRPYFAPPNFNTLEIEIYDGYRE